MKKASRVRTFITVMILSARQKFRLVIPECVNITFSCIGIQCKCLGDDKKKKTFSFKVE